MRRTGDAGFPYIGLVGCGNIGRQHLAAIRCVFPQTPVYVSDENRCLAEALADGHRNTVVYSTLREMLTDGKVSRVHIATPPSSHFGLANRAIEAGCHVLLEKPAAENADEVAALYAAAARQGTLLAVNHSVLATPLVIRALEDIHQGRFGNLIALHCDYGASSGRLTPYEPDHWAYRMRGGVLANLAPHPASFVAQMIPDAVDIQAHVASRNVLPNDNPDLLHVVVQGIDRVGSFTISIGHGNEDRRIHLLFEQGWVTLDLDRRLYTYVKGRWPLGLPRKLRSGFLEAWRIALGTVVNACERVVVRRSCTPSMLKVVENFHRAVDSGAELLVSPKNVAAVAKIMDKIVQRVEEQGARGNRSGRNL